MAEKPTEFVDDRSKAFEPGTDVTDTTKELTLSDLKGSRVSRGNPEWQPKGRQPGEDTSGKSAPAPPSRRATGAGPT